MRIGYLVPEFPGQTHVMFWREIEELESLGIAVDLVSTRPPAQGLSVHEWAERAQARTTYLLAPGNAARGVSALARNTARGARIVGSVVRGSERPVPRRAPLAGMSLVAARLAQLAWERDWDHLHVHSCANAADLARIARALGGPPYSLTLHGPLGDYGPDQAAKWASAEFGIVITDSLRQELLDKLGISAPSEILVVGMGVQPGELERKTPYVPWLGEGTAHVFSCGRLNPAKGHLYLIRAIADMRAGGVDVDLTIAGEDESGGKGYRRVLESEIERLELDEHVALLGAVPDHQVTVQLHRAHVFALASLEEPLGVAIMEAMAAATPVVATRSGGVPSLVRDGRDGVLVSPTDVDNLVTGLLSVLQNPPTARRLSSAGVTSIRHRMECSSSARVLASALARRTRAEGLR